MTHKILPSTKHLIDRLKENRPEDSHLLSSVVAFGRGSDIGSDVCFARVHNFISASTLKTMHYLIRTMSPAIDYKTIVDDLDQYFSKLYTISYFPINNSVSIVQINSKIRLSFDVELVFYWIILSILRGMDKEYTRYFVGKEHGSIKTIKDMIIAWEIGTGGTTSHTISEPLAYAYQRYNNTDKFHAFIDSWLDKFLRFCGNDSKFTVKEITDNVVDEVTKMRNRQKKLYEYTDYLYISQSPAYRILEICLNNLEDKHAKNINE